nr:hypothetical protein [uncultured Duganella sp.]
MPVKPGSQNAEGATPSEPVPADLPVANLAYEDVADLATFETNITQIELWLATTHAALSAPTPDIKSLKIHGRDIAPLLEEATRQAKEDSFGEQATRYFALIPRVMEFIQRADKLFKRDDATKAANIGGSPPIPPIDKRPSGGDDEGMLNRIEKLESDVAAIKIDVAVIKANGATKSDLAELRGMLTKDFTELKGSFGELRAATKADIADAKTSIILWVVGAIFVAQILPAILKAIPELMAMLGK